jgi:hypothetical protein
LAAGLFSEWTDHMQRSSIAAVVMQNALAGTSSPVTATDKQVKRKKTD